LIPACDANLECRFEEKKKKLASTRAVFKGGEERGGYGGEKTGIKTGLVKSVKL
jgi:U3 small nucleolar RNA-associated protein 3